MKFSVLIHDGDREGRGERRRCVKKFLVGRVIDVVQTRTGCNGIDHFSATASIDAHNVIPARNEEEITRVVQR